MIPFSLLDRPIAFHRCFVDLAGSVNAALMLSQAVYWQRCNDESAWWFQTQEKWERETGLSKREQETARRDLRELSFWEERFSGLPRKLYFRVDLDKLLDAVAINDKTRPLDDDIGGLNSPRGDSASDSKENKEVGIKEVPEAAGAESEEVAIQSQAEALYSLYPRKVSRYKALQAAIKALKIAPFETLKCAVIEYAAAVKVNLENWGAAEMRFVPHPASWFNSQRWTDDRSEWIKPPPKRTAYQVNTLIKSTQEAIDTHPANPESISGVDRPTEEQKAALRDLKTRLFNLREELNKIA